MTLETCLSTLRAQGKIDDKREAKARAIYTEIREALGDQLGADESAIKATADTLDRMKREAAQSRRQALLQASRQRAILDQMSGYRNARGEGDMAAAALAHLDMDDLADFSNVQARMQAVRGQAHSRMTDVLATFRRDMLGRVRQDARLDNVVRAAFGENVDDAAARELAKAWSETAEFLRLRFNQAGGHVAKRADWGLPQTHDMLAVRKAGFEEWRAFVEPRLAPERMIDDLTGQPMTPAQVSRSLRSVFDAISTDGWSKVTGSGAGGGKKLANRNSEARFLAFKNADAWLEYQGRFASGSPFDVMLAHVDNMSRDIAALEVFGPNPNATLRWMEQELLSQGAKADAAARYGGQGGQSNKARKAANLMWTMWRNFNGTNNAPIDSRVGRFMAGTRSFLVSSQLGSAFLSGLSDLQFQRMARMMSGLPQAKMIGQYLKLMNPARIEDQKLAVRLGLMAENWSTIALAQQRYADEVAGPEVMRRLSDFTMRASLLSPWTQAGKWAFGMEFMGALADYQARPFSKLPEPMRKTLGKYGIGSDEWAAIRKTPAHEEGGARFLRPDDIEDEDLATRLLEAIQTETEFAVPSASLRGRSMLLGDVQPGTIPGEIMRSVAMYKNFSITLLSTHLRRAVLEKGAMAKAGYAANMVIGATVMGALAMQLKDLSKGKTPADMSTTDFWGAALLQGGGLGIYGDFLFSDVNRFGGGLSETVAGPVVSAANDARRLTLGNAVELPGDKPTNAGREAVGALRKYTPGGSLWYARLAYQRILLDQLQKELDPDYAESFEAMERRARKEMDQEFWWRPGEAAPEMAN